MQALRRAAVVVAAAAAALLAPGVAEAAAWCGTTASADRPAVTTGHPVRILYLFPSDGADRSAELAPKIWADVEEIEAWWRANDPTRTPNFDVTPFSCGLQLDLTTRRMTVPAAAVAPANGRFIQIRDEIYARARFEGFFSKYLVYYDGPVESPEICGEADSAGPSGTGLAIVFLQACPGTSSAQVAAHELIHGLGALFRVTAPNACRDSPAHVCDATQDILYPVAQNLPFSSVVLDSGRDDYYGHSQPWFDVQDSRWLRHLDERTEFSVVVRGRGSVRTDVPGLNCVGACRTLWNPGIDLRLLAEPATGHRFVRWTGGDCAGLGERCDVLLDKPLSLTALFAPARYPLTVRVSGRGRVTGGGFACTTARCARALTSHRPVTLRATPAKGWRLKGWTGACRGARATCSVPMSSAASVRATFVRRANT